MNVMIKLLVILFLIMPATSILKSFVSDYDKCYSEREDEGYAVFGCCQGLVGGSRNTNYLQEFCINCPYLVLPDKEEKKDD